MHHQPHCTPNGYWDGLEATEAAYPIFMTVNATTEEAILNSLFMAITKKRNDGRVVEALPVENLRGE